MARTKGVKSAKDTAARRKKRNGASERRAAWKAVYLEQLEKHGKVYLAARLAGVSRKLVWDERKRDREFRVACAEAVQLFTERHAAELEAELFRRAKHSTPGEMDTKALLAALRRLDPKNYDKPKSSNLNVGGQPGNQLPAPPAVEQQIRVIRIVNINSHADAAMFRQIQANRKLIEERADDVEGDSPAPAIAHVNGNGKNGNGKAKATRRD